MLFEIGQELLIGAGEQFGDGLGLSYYRHKIGITLVAGYDMDMDMFRKASASRLAQVYAYIKSSRVEDLF